MCSPVWSAFAGYEEGVLASCPRRFSASPIQSLGGLALGHVLVAALSARRRRDDALGTPYSSTPTSPAAAFERRTAGPVEHGPSRRATRSQTSRLLGVGLRRVATRSGGPVSQGTHTRASSSQRPGNAPEPTYPQDCLSTSGRGRQRPVHDTLALASVGRQPRKVSNRAMSD